VTLSMTVCAARCRSHEHPRVALVSTLDGWGGGVHEFSSDGDVKFIAMTGSAHRVRKLPMYALPTPDCSRLRPRHVVVCYHPLVCVMRYSRFADPSSQCQ
jgi:hypothetical protein